MRYLIAIVLVFCVPSIALTADKQPSIASVLKAIKAQANADVNRARVVLAKARSSGDVAAIKTAKDDLAEALAHAKKMAAQKGVISTHFPKVGDIGVLDTGPGNFYRIVEIHKEYVEIAPEFEGMSSSDNGATFRSNVIPYGRNIILQSDDIESIDTDLEYYTPSGIYEVTGTVKGKAVLKTFRVPSP